ncbi:MAG: regulatory protein RecX [Chitinophagaceae bacterium]|nr:regulatory protein RecX [Rubrivivax sp.]
MKGRQPLSLRARAVAWLAQREHSELELRRKLLRLLQAEARAAAPELPQGADSLVQVDGVIAWLQERGYLDSARFIASRVHLRASRHGAARIQQELSRHGLELDAEAMRSLRASELERATAVWVRKFGTPAADARTAARQARFLTGRGFSGEVVQQLLRRVGGARRPANEGGEADDA